MKKERKNYTWLILLAIIIMIGLPYILNSIMMKEQLFNYIGKDTDWLSFWGAYLGAIISSAVAFIILFDTRRQNNANRNTQLNLVIYQQEKDRLNDLKIASVKFSNLFDTNDFIAMVAEMNTDRNKVSLSIKRLLTDIGAQYSELIIHLPTIKKSRSQPEINFINSLSLYREKFNNLVIDMQIANQYYEGTINKGITDDFYSYVSERGGKDTERLMIFIKKHQVIEKIYNHNLPHIITQYILTYYKCSGDFQLEMMHYFKSEENRINAIITQDIK